MKLATTLFFLFVTLACFAQTSVLRIEPANVAKEVVVDDLEDGYQDVTNILVTNISDRSVNLIQDHMDGKKPDEWRYGTFSRRNDSAPYTLPRGRGTNKPVLIGPGESASFLVVLDSRGVTGTGTVEVTFQDVSSPGVTLGTASFTTRIVSRDEANLDRNGLPTPSVRRPLPTRVNLYPNPARDRFFVEVPTGVKLGRVDVANTIGKRMMQFSKPAGTDGYDIEKLPDGLYLISIFDSQGKKLKTLRLLHRRFGA